MPNANSTQNPTPNLNNTTLPLLARDYLSTLYATCTDKNELEMKTVINYLNELITEDELRDASRL
ncbi:hypothetical protein [Vibrio sp. VB16]|uniref:hypothetical protein n=1 Tax=Vibrio sp. VB16 TaxID=2785746 RepID=UPI00189C5FB3|nr:hypothetical protein [Vibrio sp. VB16]UGA53568.1 hypothetical protein IUZ65_009670 [Vibrio sp. VB16]